MRRHQDAESGAARLRLALDDAAVVADDLGDQCKAEAGAVGLGGDEGVEEIGQQVVRDARPVVDTENSSGRLTLLRLPGMESRMPGRKAVRNTISGSLVPSAPLPRS